MICLLSQQPQVSMENVFFFLFSLATVISWQQMCYLKFLQTILLLKLHNLFNFQTASVNNFREMTTFHLFGTSDNTQHPHPLQKHFAQQITDPTFSQYDRPRNVQLVSFYYNNLESNLLCGGMSFFRLILRSAPRLVA